MLEILRSIPGPQFLFIFPLMVAIAIFLGKKALSYDGSTRMPPPEPSQLSPVTIASLRGDWNLVLKTVIFGLWHRKIIELNTGADKKSHFRRISDNQAPVDRVEHAVWKFLEKERTPDEFFKDPTLRSFVETEVKNSRNELSTYGLLMGATELIRVRQLFIVVLFFILALGGTKFYIGITHHQPSAFLFIMLVAAIVFAAVILRPARRLTAAGEAYLKRLQTHFEWLKLEIQQREVEGIDPAYAFAIFGTACLATSMIYAPFSEAFPGRSSSGCGGSGCGGSSSDSGSDGGGSDGGGGCGGCGGGD